jgi:hypothetical protein
MYRIRSIRRKRFFSHFLPRYCVLLENDYTVLYKAHFIELQMQTHFLYYLQ